MAGTFGESDANAYVVKRTSRGELVHWEQRAIEYTIDPSVEANVAGATEATKRAMDSWSGTVGAPDLVPVAPKAGAPTKPEFDQKNGVFFMKNGYAPAGRALAITVLTYDNVSGRILDADVIFNGTYKFEVLAENGTRGDEARQADALAHPSNTDNVGHEEEEEIERTFDNIYDLHHVIAHEVGHSVGMNDEMQRRDALMYRYSAPNDATMRSPASDDIAGLAELYSTKLEGRGNGCGNATVAPKKPSDKASLVAMAATLAFLGFLVLRARSDRRARLGFVFAAAAAAVALVPSLSGKDGKTGVARASERVPGHATAMVTNVATTIENGLFKTSYTLETTTCRREACPNTGHGATWGGTIGNITQEVGGYYAPQPGDAVDVSFAKLPNTIAPLTQPLAGRTRAVDVAVNVVTLSSPQSSVLSPQ
jgi:hypothetical protein